jgi:hypothetical protein
MGLSRLSKQCRECPFVDTCENKRMEALAYIEPSASSLVPGLVAPLTAPRLQPQEFRDIKIDVNTTVTIDLEDIKRKLSKAIYDDSFKI